MTPPDKPLPNGPTRLWLIRHGESAGNLARDAADAAGLPRVDIQGRDVEVPLSERGVAQGRALGHWFAKLPREQQPEVILSSPYLRARHTANLIRETSGRHAELSLVIDERLREREFGILDGLTKAGVEQAFPQQAQLRQVLGKFYHRPPGGESWCDVILRMRSTLHTLSLHYTGKQVLIVTHQTVVLCLRYLLENMDEAQILEIDRTDDVVNCGVTEYEYEPGKTGAEGGLVLTRYNFTAPLKHAGAAVTVAPDLSSAKR